MSVSSVVVNLQLDHWWIIVSHIAVH